ncbi:MAG: tRNA (N6-threonylcarbamoyladenosine(37)-N6)-methyltransferase TrmO [Acidobacteriota bacterium]|jgi:tRNA-Thr(GGU) m(6)t(6)A37 methyltransferase TsaA
MDPNSDAAIRIQFIGTIETPFKEPTGTPIQSVYAAGTAGRVLVHESYASALSDIEGFERLWLIYWMHRVGPFQPKVIPYRDNVEHGLFATRSPARPNPIGISVVRLLYRKGAVLHVEGVDMLDGTPLIDIKPYNPEFDAYPVSRSGWFDSAGVDRRRADSRFHKNSSQ